MTHGGCGRAYRPSQIAGAVLLLQGLITPPNWWRSWTASVHISRQPSKIQSLHLSLYQQEHPPALTLQEHEVRRLLRSVNPRKATGPEGVPGKVLRACADQLTLVCTNIFNRSLWQAIIPHCLKSATIIPIPKTSLPRSLNDYHLVALTPEIMKCFERLVLCHITTGAVVA